MGDVVLEFLVPRMGGFTCCVPGCTNNSTRDRHIRFYVFPKDPKLREIWVENIAKPGKSANSPFKPTNGYRVCSVHFEGGKKTYMINIPTIFPRNKRVELIKGNEESSSSNLDNIETECTGAGDDAHTTDTSFLLDKIKEKEQLIQDLKERISKLEDEVICIKSRRLKKLAVVTSIIHT